MVNGDHGELEAATSAGDDLHANLSTQDEIRQEDLCVSTQEEISFAELRYRGSLLQDSMDTDAIKLPLPTSTEQDIVWETI